MIDTHDDQNRSVLAVVGASVSAGVGADSTSEAWPYILGRILGRPVTVSAAPGAGYVNPGPEHLGPFSRLLQRLDLAATRPGHLIVQGGQNDIAYPKDEVRQAAARLVSTAKNASPSTAIALIPAFGGRQRHAGHRTNQEIIDGARAADPSALVLDPVTEKWSYETQADQLHPTQRGHQWIAQHVASILVGR